MPAWPARDPEWSNVDEQADDSAPHCRHRAGGRLRLERILPVSYTHLDVYNRQPARSPLSYIPPACFIVPDDTPNTPCSPRPAASRGPAKPERCACRLHPRAIAAPAQRGLDARSPAQVHRGARGVGVRDRGGGQHRAVGDLGV